MSTTTSSQDSLKKFEPQYACEKCQDKGFIVNGWSAVECSCLQQKRLQMRMKKAMIPEEFQDAEFKNFQATTPKQQFMLQAIYNYLKDFRRIQNENQNSFGFIAEYGEQKLREEKTQAKRSELKRKYNNFGIGKTHLQIAAAKTLIRNGIPTLIVSDVTLMDELSRAKTYKDEGEEFNRILWACLKADVLVWDDIGKAKTSETRRDLYYQIINDRYRNRKPIIFSSNEDHETLTERIGDASASRLFGMSKNHLYVVSGNDFRLMGA